MTEHKNETMGAVTRNSGKRYNDVFMIDCGTPENAVALADAMSEEAYGHPVGSGLDDAGKHFLGGEIVQYWPIDRFFTAAIDPCGEKAIKWCQDFLKNLGGSAPGLTDNGAGLEGKQAEALPPKLALRRKYRAIDSALKDMEAFTKVMGVTASDLHDKGFDLDMGGGEKGVCEAEAKKALSDFDECIDYSIVSEIEDGQPYWYVVVKFKPEFWELSDADIIDTLAMLDDAIIEYC